MKLHLDISQQINHQFKKYIGGEDIDNGFIINPAVGSNEAKAIFIEFPGSLEFYHFGSTNFKVTIEMHTINPLESQWLLIHINLSMVSQKKKVGNETIFFQKHLPIGILFCGPGLEMNTTIPSGVNSEVVSIRFNKDFIQTYLPEVANQIDLKRPIAYEDIDDELDMILSMALNTMENKLSCHAHVLNFLNVFFEKISKHQKPKSINKLHPEDLKNIIEVSTLLRNPVDTQIHSIPELSKKAHMGITKFKESFKLVFGLAPLQYRNRIRMEYAREQLMTKRKSSSELSYELGYSHPSNFTNAFKKYFGQLPSHY